VEGVGWKRDQTFRLPIQGAKKKGRRAKEEHSWISDRTSLRGTEASDSRSAALRKKKQGQNSELKKRKVVLGGYASSSVLGES